MIDQKSHFDFAYGIYKIFLISVPIRGSNSQILGSIVFNFFVHLEKACHIILKQKSQPYL